MSVSTKTTDTNYYKIKPPPRDGSATERRSNTALRGGRVLSARSNILAQPKKPELSKSPTPITDRSSADLARTRQLNPFV